MAAQSQAAEELEQYLEGVDNGQGQSLLVPEGAFKGWLPRVLYTYTLDTLHLPFLRLLSFPVGGTALGNLTSMKTFHAVGNYLFRLPSCFVQCYHIVSLDLSFNHFTEIPQPVFSLNKLEELNFAHNDIEEVSDHIGQLVSLRELDLAGNTLSTLPLDIAKCRRIQRLDLSGKFYPRGQMKQFPDGVCFLFELTDLNLSWQQIERIPDEFGKLKHLQRLNLKGNHLLYVSPEISKCSKLQSVNLAGALRLCSQIPAALFGLEDLQALNLGDNFFTEIPEEVCGLCRLTSLVMQRNALLRLPDNLFQLRHLDHLELSENYLEALPPSVGHLKRLTYLGLDRNRLKEIPDELCRVNSLVTLALGSNQLTKVPENIYHLSKLKELMLENNKLTELPLLLDRLEGLLETGGLSLHGNYLRTPPQEICDQGVVPLFHFLKELRVSEARHRRKMILIGAVKAGKTSLRHALMLGQSKLTAEHERTWVLERHLWEPESKLRVQILDFGGHHIYQAAHHMFLTPEALHVLVFDLSRYTSDRFDECVSNWLDAIMDRAPGATILMVGTHADLCSEDEVADRCEDVIRRIQKEESNKLRELNEEIDRSRALLERPESIEARGGKFGDIGMERLQEKLSHLEKMLNTRSQLPDKVHVVSCAEGLAGVGELRETLVNTMKEAEERKLPHSWYKFLSDIQAVPDRILSMEQALDIFVEVMAAVNQSLMGMGGSADRSLHMVLKYLHATGEIVWYHDNPRLNRIVFHRPETLIEMLRAVFRHDFEQVVIFDQEFGKKAGLVLSRFAILKEDFVRRGIMTYELLHFTLLHFQLSSDALDTFISLMLKFDLCYEVNEDNDPSRVGSTHVLQFPWFFPQEPPKDLDTHWPQKLPNNTFELRFQVEFERKGPPYFFEKLSVRLQQYVSERENWKYGVLARLNQSRLLVTRQYNKLDDVTVVTAAARGSVDLQELWWLLKQTRMEMRQLLQDWPFIQPPFSLVCTHCLLHGHDDPYHYPGEVIELPMPRNTYIARWCRKHPEVDVPACFVYPLDKDYQDDIQKHMQAATDFLQACYDSVDGPPGLLSEAGLAFIAARLGFEWILLALQLGVRQETVEQIQMSPRPVVYQIIEVLRHWRDLPDNNTHRHQDGGGDNAGVQREREVDKIRKLLQTLRQDGIEKFELVEEISQRYQIDLEG
ncbi:malignant fibrous histiocytoma-amplified sequence 1 homolog [Littorina saxatilis]|uniref:Malignant fibrous histiocytoma-amplified sequence 1 homolog n=1 Tax=Littorina saxatilis TaxID=31220 RepID=A0AAN9BXM8_9CAEN